MDLLAKSGVEAFVINPNTQVAWYPSRVAPTAWDGYTRGDSRWAGWMSVYSKESNLAMMDRYLDMLEAGVDWLETVVGLCRARGISPWLSVRMNDMHGVDDPAGNPINCPLFAEPRYRLSGRRVNPSNPPREYWAALNYACPEVRDYYFRMIRELVEGYAFEGLELDFLRNPAIGEVGSGTEFIETMLNYLADIRKLTRARAESSGRNYPLGLRIPGNLAQLKSIGLDVPTTVERGLIDFVGLSNFMQTSWAMPHDELERELGGGVVQYGVTELIFNGVKGYDPVEQKAWDRHPCVSAPALRGSAAGKLVLGVHGIEQFNYYAADEDNSDVRICTWENMRADYTAIQRVHDLEFLRGKPKHYALGTMISACWYPPFDQPELFPEVFGPDWRRAYRLPMCAEPVESGLELMVQVVAERCDDPPAMGVSFNGSWPEFKAEPTDELLFPNRPATHHLPEHVAWNYRFESSLIREGWNEITLYHGDTRTTGPQRQLTVVSLEVAVREP